MKIGLDIDDCLYGYMAAFLEFHNSKYRTHLTVLDVNDYYNPGDLPITEEERVERVIQFQQSEKFDQITPLPGARAMLDYLRENEFEIYFATARFGFAKEKTPAILKRDFGEPLGEILFTGHLNGDASYTKGRAYDEKSIDLILEDHTENILDCTSRGIRVIVPHKKWNVGIENHPEACGLVKKVSSIAATIKTFEMMRERSL